MDNYGNEHLYRCVFSLKPLIDYWNQGAAGCDACKAQILDAIQTSLAGALELLEPIEDLSLLEPHRDLIRVLMSAVFPTAFWDSELVGALVPFNLSPVIVSPMFQRLCLNEDRSLRGRFPVETDTISRARQIRSFLLILKRCYGIDKDLDYPLVRIVEDPETGLERHFQFSPNLRFVDVHTVGSPPRLTDRDLATVMQRLEEPEVLREFLPPENFEFHGFTLVHAVDVTLYEVISGLERDLIDKSSIASQEGFLRLQDRLRTLLRRPDLMVGLAAIKNDEVLLLNNGCEMHRSCIFADSRHRAISEFRGSVFDRAMQGDGISIIRDVTEESACSEMDKEILEFGIRSMMIAPLRFQGELIGALNLGSPNPDDFGPGEELVLSQILPLFSMALKRSLDDLEHNVEAVIKQKCTAVHPSVEWRFRGAALHHLERFGKGESSELEPIVFRDVFPLYGASDVRGSSEARNRAIQSDLVEHLELALQVVQSAAEARSLPILSEASYRTERHLEMIHNGFGTGDQTSILKFLRNEVEPLFPLLRGFGPGVTDRIEAYGQAMDPTVGTVYRERRDFERSISLFNRRISTYLDREEADAQAVFPHYFNKHQTDGVDYIIYAGASMVENGAFDALYVRNLRLWQLMVACGIAWHTEDIRKSLKFPLDATHLILVSHSPVSIRFRFDEKRFDVDGAYDVGHEIVRSRIDKAIVKGRNERLTQPAKIAIVYSRPNEYQEMTHHIDFLQGRGYLDDDLESLELEDLPGVQGLMALRVGVSLQSAVLAEKAGNVIATEIVAETREPEKIRLVSPLRR
ncbi:MAG: GAF domain-containing protein [Desulfomonilaceae bacterium]